MPLTKITSGEFQDSSVSFSGIVTAGSLSVPAGPVLIGSATSTGTAAQRLQVTGGGYFSGRIGIGTTNPNVVGVNDNCPVLSLYSNGANIFARSVLELTNPFTSTNGSVLGDIYFTSARTSVTGFTTEWSLIRSLLTGSLSSFGYGTAISFHTKSNNGAASFRESARFDSEANFLVGASTPTGTSSQPLQVTGGGYFSGNLGVGFTNPTNRLQVFGNAIVSGAVGVATTNPIQPFQVGAGSTIVVVDNVGDLGIGTTNPTSKLQVVGDARVSGVITAFDFYNDAEYPSVRPTLDLAFAQTKVLDSRITFTRSSTATYVNASGIVTSAATNEPRFDHDPVTGESLGLLIEEARTNSLTYSQSFSIAPWTLTGGTLIPNSTTAPDSTATAFTLIEDSSNGTHQVNYIITQALNNTFSIYAKPASGSRTLFINNGGRQSAFTLSGSGSVVVEGGSGTTGSASITQLPNGWYRCAVTLSGGAVQTNQVIVGLSQATAITFGNSYTGDNTSGIFIWGAQLEAGSFPTSYIPTPATFTSRASNATYYTSTGLVGTATTNQARSNAFFPDSNGVMRPAGLLLEAAATNLVGYSEQFDNAAWSKGGATISANATTAPDGTSTADKLVEDTSTGAHGITSPYIAQNNSVGSIFIKPAGRTRVLITNFGDPNTAIFDLTGLGTVVSGPGSIQLFPNGWYRCSVRAGSTITYGYYVINLISSGTTVSYLGDGTSGVFLWGAQIETGTYATSYIPTVASTVTRSADVSSSATVTRSADVASISGTNFSSWYRQDEGTFFSVATNRTQLDDVVLFTLGSTYDFLTRTPSGVSVRWGGSGSSAIGPANGTKVAGAYRNGLNVIGSTNGVLGSLVSASTGSPSSLNFSSTSGGGTRVFTGVHSRLTYWPTRLSNNVLQTITL